MDDETHFRSTLAKRLKKRGIAALQAGDGEECLAVLEDNPMDVVVLDVKMPGMSGIDALNRIKERYLKTEVILLTGHAATEDGVDGIKSGAFDYLTKPVEFEHLLSKIIQAYEKILAGNEKQKAAEYKALIEQQMIATERLAALGTLAAGVAHEINNPLAIINESAGYLSQLLEKQELADMPCKEVFEKALLKIENSIKRARTITHQLLGSVGKTESVLVEVDVGELVSETIQLVHKDAKDKNIVIIFQGADDSKAIWVDPNKVRQILINLMSNAIHATPEQGNISIQVENIDGGISIAVKDTGVGIPKENLEKIFEPFFSTKAPGEGTGLGLFVTRQIVEKLGGSLDVVSRVGHGTQFMVRLPDQSKVEADKIVDAHK
ncbi:MAG: response regulator [Deltaproteobacteria bacterium]|nr:response regulator [Deltaproteobacteria bacterium]